MVKTVWIGLALLAAGLPAAARPSEHRYVSLECDNVRRLSDNYLLDLRIRMVFDQSRRRVLRYENAGRGWQIIDAQPYDGLDDARVRLRDDRFVTAYIERLTGDYYYIDRSGVTLSLWARCNRAGLVGPLF